MSYHFIWSDYLLYEPNTGPYLEYAKKEWAKCKSVFVKIRVDMPSTKLGESIFYNILRLTLKNNFSREFGRLDKYYNTHHDFEIYFIALPLSANITQTYHTFKTWLHHNSFLVLYDRR